MNPHTPTPSRSTEIVVVTRGFTSTPGGIAQGVAEIVALVSKRLPIHFTWAAHGGARSPNLLTDPKLKALAGQNLMPMQGWVWLEKTFGIIWPFWNRESRLRLRQAIFAADIVWIHDTLYSGARTAQRLARKFGRPVIVTQHQSPALIPARAQPLRYAVAWLADRLLTSSMLEKARQTVFTNPAAAAFYQGSRLKVPAKIVPHGLALDLFRPPSTEDYRGLRARFALRDDQPVLLFSGRFTKGAGLTVVRRMAELLPKWRFWLVGHGHTKPEGWYLPNVQVFRNRTGAALAELYTAADLLIMPGLDAESPQILQQALACKLPAMCNPAVVMGHAAAAHCLVVHADPAAPERTARSWVHKLKAGKDAWPAIANDEAVADQKWDWPRVAAYYADIFQSIFRAAT